MKLFCTCTFVALTTLFCFGQRIVVTQGPIIDPKTIYKDFEIPRITFTGVSYSSALFFNPAKKRTYAGFGWKEKGFHFAVLENYLNYSGPKN